MDITEIIKIEQGVLGEYTQAEQLHYDSEELAEDTLENTRQMPHRYKRTSHPNILQRLFSRSDIEIMAALGEKGLPCLTLNGIQFMIVKNGAYLLQPQGSHDILSLADNPKDAARALNNYLAQQALRAQ